MTEKGTDRTVLIAVIAGVIALLLGLCLGGMVGGLGGYALGRQAANRASEPARIPRLQPFRELPRLPDLPEGQGPDFSAPEWPEGLPDVMAAGGAMVGEVIAGSPAEAAGLEVGDLITHVDDVPIDENHDLADVIATYQPGDQIVLRIWRDAEEREIPLRLGGDPDDATRAYVGVRYAVLRMQRRFLVPGG